MAAPDESRGSIPFAVPDIGAAEIAAVTAVLESRWLTTGARAAEFEERFRASVGSEHAVALNSCTAALHLALEALGVGPGDLVFVPTYTFAASAEVVRYLGAKPVLLDVDPVTLNLTPDTLERAVLEARAASGGRPRAVIPVHFAGVPCEMAEIWEVARRHDLAVVEDAAHAFPAARAGVTTGWMPEDVRGAVCFSFYATKTITTGEGGMLVTPHADIADRVRTMSLHGLSRQAWNRYASGGSWRYDIIAPGYKYNLTDVAAAMGTVQLSRAEDMRDRREAIASAYSAAFADLPVVVPTVPDDCHSAWHLYVLRVAEASKQGRDEVIAALSAAGIGTSVHFIPLHLHPYYQREYGYQAGDLPVATSQFEAALSLPIYSGLTDSEVDRVIAAVRQILT